MYKIITTTIHQLLTHCVSTKIPFTVTIKDWGLPNYLTIVLDIDNTDLEESYVDYRGYIILNTKIDGIMYTKVLEASSVLAFRTNDEKIIIKANFTYTPETPQEGSRERSKVDLYKYNPHLVNTLEAI